METEAIELLKANPYLFIYNAAAGLILLFGAAVMINWMINTRFGLNSLKDSMPRQHNLNIGIVLVAFGIWFAGSMIAAELLYGFFDTAGEVGDDSLLNSAIAAASGIFAVIACLVVGKNYFEYGISGLGISAKRLGANLGWGFVNFITIYPCVFLVIILLTQLGMLISGSDFQMPQHDMITLLAERDSIFVKIFIVFVAVIVAPIVEELLFRGIFQSMLRKNLGSPWLSIIFTSVFFAAVHGNKLMFHWPALFVLSCCLGYAYEKSGSLIRSITVHAAFNASSVLSAIFYQYVGA